MSKVTSTKKLMLEIKNFLPPELINPGVQLLCCSLPLQLGIHLRKNLNPGTNTSYYAHKWQQKKYISRGENAARRVAATAAGKKNGKKRIFLPFFSALLLI